MTGERVRHMLMMEDGRMIGIGDLVEHKLRDSDLAIRVLARWRSHI